MSRQLFLICGLLIFTQSVLVGCATTTIDSTRIQTINKLAIVGFQGVYDVKNPNESKKSTFTQVVNVAVDVARDASGKEDNQLRKALNYSYDQLVDVLTKETELKILSRQQMTGNSWYRTELEARGEPYGHDLSTVDGVIGYALL